MRKTPKPAAAKAAKAATTVAEMLDELQARQREARADLNAAMLHIADTIANLDAADAELICAAETLGLPVEG